MNCKIFERELADWVRGRAPQDLAARMAAHRDACASCARAEAVERTLVAAWSALPEPRSAPELWPQVAARLEQPAPAPRWSLFRPPWAIAGALAAGALCALLFTHMPSATSTAKPFAGAPSHTVRKADPAGVAEVISLVSQMRQLPDPDSGVPTMDRRALFIGEAK